MTGAGAVRAGVWAAPGRVNLIGEHTDYNDGFVLPFALSQQVTAEAARRSDGLLRLRFPAATGGGEHAVDLRVDALEPGRGPRGWAGYAAGVVWALRDAGHAVGGAEVTFASTVPPGAGLSSSAALEVACALALNDLYGLGVPGDALAVLCRRAENAYTGAPTGIMDQAASACCTPGHALFLDTRDLSRRHVPFDPAAHDLALLVVDTRVQHAHADGEYGRRRAGCEAAARALGVRALRDVPHGELAAALRRLPDAASRGLVRHVVTENERVLRAVELLAAGDLPALGPVLTAGHASLRDDFRVSCPEVDLAVGTALSAGALGARMTGGGFGGSVVALVAQGEEETVGEAVAAAFATASYAPPRWFRAEASAGARRLS
ncbi:galactokinase [Streptomyces sp. NPDC048057]|uniref:galactokinase n=1 Tax=Streptomyces sp. NPDC048057 TaxID=3155628 RepID=UPI0033E1FFBE